MGWEPGEVHDHEFDDAGRMVRTVVTREAEWDDMERAKMLALVDYEASLCECGLPESYADEDPDLDIQHRVCPVCAGLARAARIQAEADSEAVKLLGSPPPADQVLPTDGRHILLAPKRIETT